jgi:small-conductance mechanosensitive channel
MHESVPDLRIALASLRSVRQGRAHDESDLLTTARPLRAAALLSCLWFLGETRRRSRAGSSDSAIEFVMRPWANREDYWEVYWDLTQEVTLRLDREEIKLGVPRQDVLLSREPDAR